MPYSRPLPVALVCLICFVAPLAGAAKRNEQSLRSPWDLHSVAPTEAKYDCPAVTALPHDIVAYDYYSDSKHSIIDPARYAAYQAASRQFAAVEDAAERAADEFQNSGSRDAARCAAQILFAQAQVNAMTGNMSSNQAYYVQNWAMGAFGVAWLKARPAGPAALGLSTAQTSALTIWMKTVAGQVRDYFEGMHQKDASSGRNNHYYWAGFAALAAGIAADDHSLYDWGVDTYKFGVDQIQPDGTLPLEMARGQRAVHYHLFALAPLVTMAELASANGDDLYDYDDSRLKLLVNVSVAGLADNHFFAEKAGVAQDTPKDGQISVSDISWIKPYARRFPSPTIATLLAHATIGPDRYLGGLPPP